MTHALTLAAIEACASRGAHRWVWVPTWGVAGFQECRDCGETRATRTASGEPVQPTEQREPVPPPALNKPAGQRMVQEPCGPHDLDDRDGAAPQEHGGVLATHSPRIRPSTKAGREQHAAHLQAQRDQRNAEILRLRAAGVPAREIAARVGVHFTHVYAVISQAKRSAAAGTVTP